MARKASSTTSPSTATIGFEAKLWLAADKLYEGANPEDPASTNTAPDTFPLSA